VQVVICHPKLVETGLDLLDFPTILFYESDTRCIRCGKPAAGRGGLDTTSRASEVSLLRRDDAASCLRLMGKNSSCSHHGGQVRRRRLQSIDEDDDMLSAMARNWSSGTYW